MFDSIIDSKCWINFSKQFCYRDKKEREKLFYTILIVVISAFAIYFYHTEIKKITKQICKAIEIPIDFIKDTEDVLVDSFSSSSKYSIKRNGVFSVIH
jgi:hypothetical protein